MWQGAFGVKGLFLQACVAGAMGWGGWCVRFLLCFRGLCCTAPEAFVASW